MPSRGCVYVRQVRGYPLFTVIPEVMPIKMPGTHLLLKSAPFSDADMLSPTPTLSGRGVVYQFGKAYGAVELNFVLLLGRISEENITATGNFTPNSAAQYAVRQIRNYFEEHRVSNSMNSTPVSVVVGGVNHFDVLLQTLRFGQYDGETNSLAFVIGGIIVPKPFGIAPGGTSSPNLATAASTVSAGASSAIASARNLSVAANRFPPTSAEAIQFFQPAGAAASTQASRVASATSAVGRAIETSAPVGAGTSPSAAVEQRSETLAGRMVNGAASAFVRQAGRSATSLLPSLASGRISSKRALRSFQRSATRSVSSSVAKTLGGAIGGKVGAAISTLRVDGLSLSAIGDQLKDQAINQASQLVAGELANAAFAFADRLSPKVPAVRLPAAAVPTLPAPTFSLQGASAVKLPSAPSFPDVSMPTLSITGTPPVPAVPSSVSFDIPRVSLNPGG